ncbi:MAG TPA: hypothetical protein VGG27_15720 [Magnetospirillaceae bacterium]
MATSENMNGFIKWCRQEIADLKQQLEPMESGRMHMGSRSPGGQWRDITGEQIESLRRNIVELERVIKEHE